MWSWTLQENYFYVFTGSRKQEAGSRKQETGINKLYASVIEIKKKLSSLEFKSRNGPKPKPIGDDIIKKRIEQIANHKISDDSLHKSGFADGFKQVNEFINWSAEPVAAGLIMEFNKCLVDNVGKSLPYTAISDGKFVTRYSYRRYPYDSRTSGQQDDLLIKVINRIILQKQDNKEFQFMSKEEKELFRIKLSEMPEPSNDVILDYCNGFTLGVLTAIEKNLIKNHDFAKPELSVGDVLMHLV